MTVQNDAELDRQHLIDAAAQHIAEEFITSATMEILARYVKTRDIKRAETFAAYMLHLAARATDVETAKIDAQLERMHA